MKTVGEVIRERRQDRKLSSTALSKKARVNLTSLSMYEHGQVAKPDLEHLQRIAKVLGLSFVSLKYRLYWQLRPSGVERGGMVAFLGSVAKEEATERTIEQLKKKAAV